MTMKRKVIGLACFLAFTCAIPTYASSSDLDKIQQEADERSANSTTLTSGNFYDYVSSLCSGAIITDYHDGTVSVDLTDAKINNMYSDSFNFFWLACRILGTQKFLPDYKEISFSYMEGDTIASLRIYDYEGIDSFTSNMMCFGSNNDSIASSINLNYDKIFHNFDQASKSDQAYDDIAKKYGVPYSSNSQAQDNDYWWLMSSYDPYVTFSFKNNKAIINYSKELSDAYDDGYSVFKEVRDSTGRYSIVKYISGGVSFDTIDVVCFDGKTRNHLFDFSTTFQSDLSWKNSVVSIKGESFKEGVLAASKE